MDEKCHPECRSVTAVESLDEARGWAKYLEEKEAERSGLTRAAARPIVSRKTGVPEGKLYSLWRNRLKDTGSWKERLRAAVIRELQADLRIVEHQLQIARQTGVDPRHPEVDSLEASKTAYETALGVPPALDRGGGK